MAIFRSVRNQSRLPVLTVIILVFLLLAMLWYSQSREYYKNLQIANERCVSELSSVRYQLDVVSEYKKKMDWLLMEAQKENEIDKGQVTAMMDNYNTLKHHLYICEGQTEELEIECKKLKEELSRAKLELKELQSVREELARCKKPAS